MLTFGSLFAGIGGIDRGLEAVGMTCKWQVEIDDYASQVLQKHWPDVYRARDIIQCGSHNLERVDVIAGGFPCQDISYAGKGAGIDGERSGLFFEAMRVVRELGPRYVLLENVPALLTRGIDRVLGTLASLGYDAEWECLPAAAFGAPHIRDRIFILAYPDSELLERPEHERERFGIMQRTGNTRGTVSDAKRQGAWNEGKSSSRQGRESTRVFQPEAVRQEDRSPVPEGIVAICNNVSDANSSGLEEWQGKDTSGTRTVCRAKPSRSEWWEVEPTVGELVNGVSGRLVRFNGRVTESSMNRREKDRRHKLRCLGNAVVPQVAEYMAMRILNIEASRRLAI